MKQFDLWLDESGSFENDSREVKKGANPSLVGGLLVETGSFSDASIRAILPEDVYHSVEIKDSKDTLQRFRSIEEKLFKNDSNRLVVFSKQEYIMIIDNSLTYLNIMSEGILQLIKNLKARYGEIRLRVLIANRVDTTTGREKKDSVVDTEEYIKRLREKLVIGGMESSISEKEWELDRASAKKDKRLMLADIVCNTIYTRHKDWKFDQTERDYIESVYSDSEKTLIFTAFESVLEKRFREELIENRIGEAVVSVCISDNKDILKRSFRILEERLESEEIHDVRFQYRFIEAYIEYYLNEVRDFDMCLRLLQNLLDYYIPLLEKKNVEYAFRLRTDIEFYMITVYTHLGDIRRIEQLEKICDAHIRELPVSPENMNYRVKFENRQIGVMIDRYDFEGALEHADVLVDRCIQIKELIELVSDDTDVKYDELAKALGTRLQARTFLVRNNRNLYNDCVEDSEKAISMFSTDVDQRRQYSYRVHLETEYGQYEEALKYLKMSVGVGEAISIKELWKKAVESPYSVSAYIRLMAEGDIAGWERAEEMYTPISSDRYIDKLIEKETIYHPGEIILWKLAMFCSHNKMHNAAEKYYEKAMSICFSEDKLTMCILGLGIGFEYYAFLLKKDSGKATSFFRILNKRLKNTQRIDSIGSVDRVFGNIDLKNEEPEYFWSLSRKITY
ncbi:MAG: hypothetical protein K5639_07925 [Eubacterium sp.]|nr:hypothetical protein [Eubacterium sp.]